MGPSGSAIMGALMRAWTVTMALIAACAAGPPNAAPTTTLVAPAERATVAAVVDGDTIRVLLPGGEEEPVRLIGIDAPELGEPLFSRSRARLAELVEDRTVTLVADVSDRDRHGRLLRYVYAAEVLVNREMVREGWAAARRYEPDTALAAELEAAQAEAEADRAGMWGAPPTTWSTSATRVPPPPSPHPARSPRSRSPPHPAAIPPVREPACPSGGERRLRRRERQRPLLHRTSGTGRSGRVWARRGDIRSSWSSLARDGSRP